MDKKIFESNKNNHGCGYYEVCGTRGNCPCILTNSRNLDVVVFNKLVEENIPTHFKLQF